ncbi:dirigent protein 1-like [Triticum dicoccoides]|uniref:dirigent protein 1-like n=1 Tax=Triticum dicoccoides TaxID=85692 RepID=UPI00188F2D1C|nr:dirigent protein 1-like [Triticum dicoccoides]
MAFSSSLQLALLVALVLSTPAPAALAAGSKATRIRLYIHERFEGANATVASPLLRSPLGGNATFGEPGVIDDELRAGPHPGSDLVGRFQDFFVGTDRAGSSYLSTATLVFTTGERRGSTLTVQGQYHFDFDGAPVERAVVGGTGEFRMARGYSAMKVVSAPTPETVVFRIDLFVLLPRPGHYF